MTGDINPALRRITHDIVFKEDISVAEAAGRVREYLGLSIEEQSKWPSDEAALEKWRRALQDVGVSVFKDAFKVLNYSGFCLYDRH